MASKKITELNAANNVTGTDLLLTVVNPSGVAATRKITVSNFFGNISTTVSVSNNIVSTGSVTAQTFIIPQKTTPANSTALTISSGSIFHDTEYLYVATSNNVVKRVLLSTF